MASLESKRRATSAEGDGNDPRMSDAHLTLRNCYCRLESTSLTWAGTCITKQMQKVGVNIRDMVPSRHHRPTQEEK